MITMIKKGLYRLIETYNNTKILLLDHEVYAWIYAKNIGGLLVLASIPKRFTDVISEGAYHLYDVFNEPELTDLEHLELQAGNEKWQGYLLLSGLPEEDHPKSRIIPTGELIRKPISQKRSPWQDRMKVASEYVWLANNPMLMSHKIIGLETM